MRPDPDPRLVPGCMVRPIYLDAILWGADQGSVNDEGTPVAVQLAIIVRDRDVAFVIACHCQPKNWAQCCLVVSSKGVGYMPHNEIEVVVPVLRVHR